MNQTDTVNTPSEQYDTSWSDFERVFSFPFEQAVETQRNAAVLMTQTMEMQDQIQRQNLDMARELFNSYFRVMEESMTGLSRTINTSSHVGTGTQSSRQPTSIASSEQQVPHQATGTSEQSTE